MTQILVGPMLRYVSETSATIFLETDGPAEVDVNAVRASTFEVGRHHYALVILEDLAPGSTVEYRVRLDGEVHWPPAGSTMPASAPEDTTPAGLVGGFEEYTWLYHESSEPEVERWVLSVVPSAMIFDDHDMIDDLEHLGVMGA